MTSAADKLYYQQMLDALTKACVAADITPEEVGRIRKMRGYQGQSKDAEGEVNVTDMFAWEISPKWDDGPEWPVIDQPTRPRLARVKPLVDRTADTVTTLYVPDLQAGFILPEGHEPIAMHDRRAMNLYIQANAIIRPDRVVYLGDNLDLADWSIKFARTPTMANSTNMTLVELLAFLEQMCAVNPDAEYDYLEGNHENRILKLLVANAEAAFGVRRPGERWPVLSVPYLLNFEDLGITWHGGYPAGAVWLRDDIRAIHGKRLSAERASKDPIIVSQFQGHTHRLAAKSRTHTGLHGEPIHTIHVECGTGARIDGAVPSFGSGTDDIGAPVIGNESEDWQQGCVISTHDPSSHDLPEVELVPFTSGRCRLRGELLESEVGL